MQLQVERLRQALTLVEPAVAKRATLPITQNVLVAVGQVHATNLEVEVSAPLPEAGDARFILPFKQVKEALKYLPRYEMLQAEISDSVVKFRTSKTQFQFNTYPTDDFPPLRGQPEHEAEVDGDAFLAGLEEVVDYAATEQSRPVLNGVCVTLGDPVEVAGADGFRLAWKPLGFSVAPQGGQQHMVIPSASISLLRKVWRNAPKAPALPTGTARDLLGHNPSIGVAKMVLAKRPMKLWFNVHTLSCRFGGVKVTTQLIQGEFPNYKMLIPGGQEQRVVMDAESMALALRQVQSTANEGSGIVRLSWENEQLRLEARGEEVGAASVTIPCSSQGGPAHIAFNVRYLLEYFTGRQGQVMLEVTTPSSPGLFTYRGMPNVVLMPLFVQWDGDPPAEEANQAPIDGQPQDDTEGRTDEGEPQEPPQSEDEMTDPTGEVEGEAGTSKNGATTEAEVEPWLVQPPPQKPAPKKPRGRRKNA